MSTKTYRYVVFIPITGNLAERNYKGNFYTGGYKPVAVAIAENVQDVFLASKEVIAPSCTYQTIAIHRPLSVGDMLVREDAKRFVYIVETFGFVLHQDDSCLIEDTEEVLRLMPIIQETVGRIEGFTQQEVSYMEQGNKIEAIRSYREGTRVRGNNEDTESIMSLKQAKDDVEDYMLRHHLPKTTGIE